MNIHVSAQTNRLDSIRNIRIDSSLRVLTTAKEDTNRVLTLCYLSEMIRKRNPDSSAQFARQALLLSGKLMYKKGEGDSYFYLGEIYFRSKNRNYTEAIKNYLFSIRIYEEIDYQDGLSTVYNNLGALYITLGNYPEALKYLLKMAQIDGSTNNANITSVYTELGYYDEVLQIYFDGLKKFKEKNGYESPTGLMVIGDIYRRKGDYSKAINYLLAGINTKTELTSKYILALSYNSLSDTYLKQVEILQKERGNKDSICSKLNEALKYSLAEQRIAEELKDKQAITESYIGVGKVYSKLTFCGMAEKNYNKALLFLKQGLILAKEIAFADLIKEAYLGLASAYKGMKNYSLALEYTDLANSIKDSLFNDQSSKKIEQLRIQYEVETAVAQEKSDHQKQALEKQTEFERKLSDERLKSENLAAEEKVKHQRVLLEENYRYQTALASQKLQQEKLLMQAKLKDEQALAEERIRLQKIEADEKLRHERALYKEQIRHENEVADQKRSQDKVLNEKDRNKNMILFGMGFLLLTGLFSVIYIRQRSAKKRAIQKAEANHKMAELELQSLRAQLNPHFMFNSLNAIQELILKEDNDNSHLYLSRFSELLRMLLDNANQPFVPLRKEINLLELYLSLENLRVPDLKYSIEIDPTIDSNRITIPNMMLQPYIENAIWHGLSHKKGERNLKIRIIRKQDNIVCEVEDNGVGRKMATELKSLYRKEHRSRGMELLSKRFSLLSKEYGSDIQTAIEDLHDNGTAMGTRVTITVPSSLIEQFKPVYS